MSTDFHVHFGQWGENYFDSKKVFEKLKNFGTDEIWFSSTTSERYCKESFAVQANESLKDKLITGQTLYELIRYEIQEAILNARNLKIIPHPLYWVIPEIHLSNIISVEKAIAELPYEGFKIHPRGNYWCLSDKRIHSLADEIFSCASRNKLMILIHCGEDSFELPTVFEKFIAEYPDVIVQLAHCRPLKETLYMLKKYPNVFCDTAFASEQSCKIIREQGFSEKLRYGSDFPIGVLQMDKEL